MEPAGVIWVAALYPSQPLHELSRLPKKKKKEQSIQGGRWKDIKESAVKGMPGEV